MTAPQIATIDSLFEQWRVMRAEWLSLVGQSNEESPESQVVWDQMIALEHQMVAIPARTASDLVKKMYAWQSGEVIEGPIMDEINELVKRGALQ